MDNIETEIEKEEELKVTMYEQNEIINQNFERKYFEENFRIKTHLRNRRNNQVKKIIVEVAGDIRRVLLKGKINIGWRRSEAKDYLAITQC